jgi:hypothetical protein
VGRVEGVRSRPSEHGRFTRLAHDRLAALAYRACQAKPGTREINAPGVRSTSGAATGERGARPDRSLREQGQDVRGTPYGAHAEQMPRA